MIALTQAWMVSLMDVTLLQTCEVPLGSRLSIESCYLVQLLPVLT